MDTQTIILQIHESIIQDQLLAALDLLESVDIIKADYKLETLSLKARIHKLKKLEILGTLAEKDLELERNKIRKAVIELTETANMTTVSDDEAVANQNTAKEFLIELLRNLEITKSTFKAQRNVRIKLVKMLSDRIKDVPYSNAADYLHELYDRMEPGEKRLQKIIRGYTKNVIHKTNQVTLDLLKDNYAFIDTIKRLDYLEKHLIIWNSKYDSIFDDESICLIYVGPDEGMRFPTKIEDEIQDYLDNN